MNKKIYSIFEVLLTTQVLHKIYPEVFVYDTTLVIRLIMI